MTPAVMISVACGQEVPMVAFDSKPAHYATNRNGLKIL